MYVYTLFLEYHYGSVRSHFILQYSVLTKSRYITKQFTKQDFLEKNHVVIKTSYIFTLENLPDEMRVKKGLITGIKNKQTIILNNLISVVNDKESTGSLIWAAFVQVQLIPKTAFSINLGLLNQWHHW